MGNIGYIRQAPTELINTTQLQNVELDRIYQECISADEKIKPIFEECLLSLRKNDTLYLASFLSISSNLQNIKEIIQRIINNQINICFHDYDLFLKHNEKNTLGNIYKYLDIFHNFNTSISNERRLLGIEKAKKEGKMQGRPRKLTSEQRIEILEQLVRGVPASYLAQKYNVHVTSIYKMA